MPCTTILVGKGASSDGSTMIARNDDGGYDPKKMAVFRPGDYGKTYRSVLSKVAVPLPAKKLRITAMPNAVRGQGCWAACGVNEENVGMTATETITSNPRVLGADPYVPLQPRRGRKKEVPGGIGEEDIVMLVLPYIHSAREGVLRLGKLLEKYGTYEPNGIAFSDSDEIWLLETVGGHHWIASRIPDDAVVIMPNQLSTQAFDLKDALSDGKNFLCSGDMEDFIRKNHLDLSLDGSFNPKVSFGSHSDADHVYNTPRAWYMGRYLCPHAYKWEGEGARYTPESDDIPLYVRPERRVTVEDVKYLLSSHYQGTPYDPYGSHQDKTMQGKYRSIGIARTDFMALIQIRPYLPASFRAIEWVCYGPNPFNAMIPLYANVDKAPAYLACTSGTVSTESFYWASRLIGALSDAAFSANAQHIERYQAKAQAKARELIGRYDREFAAKRPSLTREQANEKIAQAVRELTDQALYDVLKTDTLRMKCNYSRTDN